MPKNTPVVLSDNSQAHVPLASGEKLSPGSIPVSAESNNNITVKDDGLFVPPFSGLTTINHDYSLGGSGSAEDPLTVRVSNLDSNAIEVRQQEDSSGGLYVNSSAFMQSVAHDNSLNGDGSVDDELGIRISNKTDNVLQFIDQEVGAGGGLYVPPAKTMKRKTTSGNLSFNYPDNPAAASACGKYGNGVYWKTIVTLSQPDNGDTNVMVHAQLQQIPCRSDKTPVPYQVFADYRAISGSEKPSVMLWLICMEAPTHLLDTSTGTTTQLTIGASGVPGGLNDLYPSGDVAIEPRYIVQYLFSSAS
ncbi:hypothetical protein [Escherichia coli]|uniref:hypothetical protein n=1 Tax=Escherichia coli TaxID=562 RepID=UPI001C406617|nr:hypothetical protein [Escherichia coli]